MLLTSFLLPATTAFFLASVFTVLLNDQNYFKPTAFHHDEIHLGLVQKLNLHKPFVTPSSNEKKGKVDLSWKLLATYISDAPMALISDGAESYVLHEGQYHFGYKVTHIEKQTVYLQKGDTERHQLDLGQFAVNQSSGHTAEEKKPLQHYDVKRGGLNMLLENPEQILKEVGFAPIIHNGRFEGIKITRIHKEHFFFVHGMRKDDLIVAINNKTLNSLADALDFYTQINKLKTAAIRVKRNEQLLDFSYSIVQ